MRTVPRPARHGDLPTSAHLLVEVCGTVATHAHTHVYAAPCVAAPEPLVSLGTSRRRVLADSAAAAAWKRPGGLPAYPLRRRAPDDDKVCRRRWQA